MSLFIGTLAFEGQSEAVGVRLGVLVGSLLSALVGYAIIRSAGSRDMGEATIPREGDTRQRTEEGA